jgi:hypothetical protein
VTPRFGNETVALGLHQPYRKRSPALVYILLNVVPIGLAALLGLLVGAGWTQVAGAGQAGPPSLALTLGAFVALFWLASILAGALILAPPQAGEWTMAIGSAVVIWVGFVLPALAVTLAYRRVPGGAIALDCAYWLVVMLLQAVLMKAYGLVPPPGAPGA